MSIIIPAYNTAKYIHRAIESSLRQTHKNVEVLVIDDGSSDETLSVARNYEAQDSRVRVFTQKNAGVSAARNLGIREAGGEYMMFLDSDDWLEDNAVEFLLEAQRQYPDRLIAAGFYAVQENGAKKEAVKAPQQTIFLDIHDIAEGYCGAKNAHAGFHSACAKIYVTEILAHHHIDFPEGISYSEDAVFVIKYLYQVNGAVLLNNFVYNVLERQSSAIRSHYSTKMLQSQIDAYEILINLPENNPEIKKLMSISRTNYIAMYLGHGLDKSLDGLGAAEIAQIREYLKPHARDFLSYEKLSVKRKVKFLFEMYLPLWSGRIFMFVWNLAKRILRRK